MQNPTLPSRRFFLGTTAAGLGALAQLALGSAAYANGAVPAAGAVAATPTLGSFGPLRHIDAGLLNVGYADVGPVDGPVVVLLHGWPYDIHSFVEVAPLLVSAGYRVIVHRAATRPVEVQAGDGERAVSELRAAGVEVID